MAVTKDEVLASLARGGCPDGTPLHKSGALSDVVATDGKVFFSITVDAARCRPGSRCASRPRRSCGRCRA